MVATELSVVNNGVKLHETFYSKQNKKALYIFNFQIVPENNRKDSNLELFVNYVNIKSIFNHILKTAAALQQLQINLILGISNFKMPSLMS